MTEATITTLPHPAPIMPGRQARVTSAALVKLTSNALVQSAGDWSTKARGTEGAPIDPMPALFTSTSTGPQAANSATTAAGSVKSATWPRAVIPSAASSAARSWMRSVVDTISTAIPACPSARAQAKPIPSADPAPVTSTRWRRGVTSSCRVCMAREVHDCLHE